MTIRDNISYELNLLKKGVKYVAGIDEVGRGPLAGPFVVAAVVLDIEKVCKKLENLAQTEDSTNNDVLYSQINDSKKVTEKRRCILDKFIRNEALSYSIQIISPQELDDIGISTATQNLFYKAINELNIKPEHVLTDTFEIKMITKSDQTNITMGDSKSITIGAASIIAKVFRDNIMVEEHQKYPLYGFDKHKGYGTKYHIEALNKYGPCEIHRKSFEPVKTIYKTLISRG